jgi:chromosome partitioning protein
LARGYDVVICDGPPRLGDVTRSAAVAADVVVIPLRPGPLDWWAANETIQLLDSADQIRAELQREPVRRLFVLNCVAPNTRIVRQALDAISSTGGELAPVTIGNRVAFPECMFNGESVLTTAPGTPAADEIARLCDAILSETVGS